MEDADTILCVRIEDGFFVVTGSIKRKCDTCGAQVWFSPSALQHEKSRTLRILCVPCGKKEIGIEEFKKIMPYPGQIKEIIIFLKSQRLN